jgi:hypothetical protein
MNDPAHAVSVTRTLRLKVRAESYAWLNAAAVEVNAVWNWCNETSAKAARPFAGKAKWLSGFDLNNLSAGATEFFARIGADTIQRINGEYAHKRRAAQRLKLRWRVSRGVRRSLGWIPFKAASLKRRGVCLRFAGQCFRVFDREYLGELKWRDGCFAQDTVGDWYLCLPVEQPMEQTVAPHEAVGIDLGLKTIATTSDGDTLEAGPLDPVRSHIARHRPAPRAQAPGEAHSPQNCTATPGRAAQIQYTDGESISDHYRRRREQFQASEDPDGQIRVGFRLGSAQTDAAV